MSKLLTPDDIANRLGITRRTAVRWLAAGELPAIPLPSGDYRMEADDLAAWEAERKEVHRLTAQNGTKRQKKAQGAN